MQGQPLAVVVAGAKARAARRSLEHATLDVEIDDAHIELPDAERKDLQSLDVPPDIVLVDGGTPLNKRAGEEAAALLAHRKPQGAGGERPAKLRLQA